MSAHEQAPTNQAEVDFSERANRIIDYKQTVAESEALFNTNAVEVAAALQDLMKTKLEAGGRTAGTGSRIPDEEREDSASILATKRANIAALDPTPMGTISPEVLELVESYRAITEEATRDVAAGDVAWLHQGFDAVRADEQVAKYQSFARQLAEQGR